MSSYAEAAASSGPIGAEKIPSPPQIHSTTVPSGSVEVLDDEEFEKVKESTKDKGHEIAEDTTKIAKDLSKELDDLDNKGKSLIEQISTSIKKGGKSVYSILHETFKKTSEKSSTALTKTNEELKNPVVLTQSLIAIAGAAGGYFLYLERHRINTDNKVVLGIHASIITALVLVDGYLFSKYYPKYDKKN